MTFIFTNWGNCKAVVEGRNDFELILRDGLLESIGVVIIIIIVMIFKLRVISINLQHEVLAKSLTLCTYSSFREISRM